MESDSRSRRGVKVVRVLCDGCERASAVAYCTECNETACQSCKEHLHVGGRRSSKRGAQRNCKGRSMKDLHKAVGVLALCTLCKSRPAYRYSNGEVYGVCDQCRRSYKSDAAAGAHDVVKRAIADEIKRSTGRTSSSSSSSVASGRRRQKYVHHHSSHKKHRDRHLMEEDSTGDDMTKAFSRESSAE